MDTGPFCFLMRPGKRLAVLLPLLIVNHACLAAGEFTTPAVTTARVEWRAVLDTLRSEIVSQPSVASAFTFPGRRRAPPSDPRSTPALVQLNAVTSDIFPGIGRSAVPVLLPFDTASFLAARQSGAPASLSVSRYQADFRAAEMFDAGPAGYDAVFLLEPRPIDGLPPRIFTRPVEVQITGSLLSYDLDDPAGGRGEPVKALGAQFPDLRRFIREGYVRYAFTRFGVPYVVSIQCLDSVPRAKRLACREAGPVAERFLKALRVTGGLPSRPGIDRAAGTAERPAAVSAAFTYLPPGDIVPNSGYRGQGGRADLTSYSQIRFPLQNAPVYVKSQSFRDRKASHKPKLLDRLSSGPEVYPWRDSFCEARDFGVGQCANGFGHQGQDIRPACASRSNAADRCDPAQQPVVAVRDGVLIRSRGEQAATLQINSGLEHVRFRYMHMNPTAMDGDGVASGRRVAEGERIGVVSNYLDHPNGTTRHLHFDVQVFTRDGWLWVNPYATLISAYERLIGGRGREIVPGVPALPAVAHAMPEPPAGPAASTD